MANGEHKMGNGRAEETAQNSAFRISDYGFLISYLPLESQPLRAVVRANGG